MEEYKNVERDKNVQVPFDAERVYYQTKIIQWRSKIKRGKRRRGFADLDDYRGLDGISKILGKVYIPIQGLLPAEWYHKYHAVLCMKKRPLHLSDFLCIIQYKHKVVQP